MWMAFLRNRRSVHPSCCQIYFTFHHSVSWHHHCNSCLQVIVCKLRKDEFLASPRVTSIHTIGNPYQACLQHLAGKVKLSSDIRDLTQEEGWKTQKGTSDVAKDRNAQSCALFLQHSAILSPPAVLLCKVPNTSRMTAMIFLVISAVLSMNWRTLSLVTSQPKISFTL